MTLPRIEQLDQFETPYSLKKQQSEQFQKHRRREKARAERKGEI